MTPSFSIITPMYEGAAFVAETIESVLRQSEQNWELIIVDDCSPDNGEGAAVVRKYILLDNRIRLIQLAENRGAAGARNAAMRDACGQYFAFLDSDDIWDPDYLAVMREHIIANTDNAAAIFFSSYRRMNADCSRELLPPYKCAGIKDYHSLLFHCPIFPSATIFDTSKLKRQVFFREVLRNLRDDYVFWLDIMKQGLVAVGYDDILVAYRMRNDSLTASKFKMIKPQWNVYRHILKMNVPQSFFYLCSWTINGLRKYGKV
jgi:glycosyltransferase involved in cell wall biosynthesis